MKKQDIKELREQLRIDRCTIDKLHGVYVSTEKEKVFYINDNFRLLEQLDIFKHLSIIDTVLSTKVGDNVLVAPFCDSREAQKKKELLKRATEAAKEAGATSDMEGLYDTIIGSYDYAGDYFILLYHDVYDIPCTGTDRIDQNESDDVYEYIICAICPVTTSDQGLTYDKTTEKIKAATPRKTITAPQCGFIYPDYENWQVDPDKVMFYTKNAKDPEKEHALMEIGLGMQPVQTSKEIQRKFETAITRAFEGNVTAQKFMPYICEKIYMIAQADIDSDAKEVITPEKLEAICKEEGFNEAIAQTIVKKYKDIFTIAYPTAQELISNKIISQIEAMWERREWAVMYRRAAEEIKKLAGEETPLCKELIEKASRA